MIRVALPQIVDLVEFQFVILGRVDRHAMIDGQGDVPVGKKGDEIIQILQGRTAGRYDDRSFGEGNPLDQEPIVQIGTGDLDDGQVQFLAEIHRRFIEWRRHGHATLLLDSGGQRAQFRLGQPCALGLRNITYVLAAFEALMDKTVHIAKLEFDRCPDIIESHHLGIIINDLQPAFQPPPMVIGQFQHEQIFENGLHQDVYQCDFVNRLDQHQEGSSKLTRSFSTTRGR